MNKLYEYIESLCRSHNITITEMCRQTKISRSSLSDLKRGRNQFLSTKAVTTIADYFGVNANDMLAQQAYDFSLRIKDSGLTPLLSDISRLAARQGEDSPIVQKATEIESQKKRIDDALKAYCRVDMLDADDLDGAQSKCDTLAALEDIVKIYFTLDDEGQRKLMERASELKVLAHKK